MKKTKRFLSFALMAIAMILASCFAITEVRANDDDADNEIVTVTYDLGEYGDPITVDIAKGGYAPYVGEMGIPHTIGDAICEGVYADPNYSSYYNWDNELESDVTIYLLFVPYDYIIHEVEIEFEPPKAGDEATIEPDPDDEDWYIWNSAEPQLDIVVPDDAPYETPQPYEDYNGDTIVPAHNYWIMGFEGDDYDTPFTGTFEAGKDYYVEIVLDAIDDWIFGADTTVMVNGEEAEILYNDWGYISIGYLLHIPNVYEILDGADQTIGADEDLTVRASGGLDRFLGLQVDGEDVSEDDYTVEEGSTIATLKASFLNTLEVGEHTLTFLYDDGEVSTTFNIVRPIIPAAANLNPKTMDNVNYTIVTMLISAMGMAAISLNKKRYN